MTPLHYAFVEDARRHPQYTQPQCEVLVIHGVDDPTVSIETSREFIRRDPTKRRLIEVQDGHQLMNSLDVIEKQTSEFFGLTEDADGAYSSKHDSGKAKL